MFRNEDNDRLATRGRTSVCKSSVMNLGNNPRVFGVADSIGSGVANVGGAVPIAEQLPAHRSARNHLPSHTMVRETLLRCLPMRLTHGEGRAAVASRFNAAMGVGRGRGISTGPHLCATPLSWIEEALSPSYDVTLVHSLDDIMGMEPGTGEFFLMDVILNRKLIREVAEGPHDPDHVVMASAKSDDTNLLPDSDFKYRTVLAFLPGAGVFYCARERRPAAVGLPNTPVHHDVSWLRITEDNVAPLGARFSFGTDGFVRRFSQEFAGNRLPSSRWVSAWRVSASNKVVKAPPRSVFMAQQCHDCDGPRMPPDMVSGVDIGAWPAAERGVAYNSELASAKSAKIGGRFYAKGCLHTTIPDDCLVIHSNADIVVDIAASGSFQARKSWVKARYLLTPLGDAAFLGRSDEPLLLHELKTIVLFNTMLRKKQPVGSARDNKGDNGAMHPFGTRVLNDGLKSTVYTTMYKVPTQLAKAYVTALSRVGQVAFPDVLAVIQDTEGDTGMKPCAVMAGDAAGNRVGFSIDTSDDLANASHYDGNDASQGYTAWTEEVPGRADNWFFIMPNVYGVRPDGRPFNGIAIRLRHGVAISWDGRLIRHCTSVTNPDGPEGHNNPIGGNHVYGTFTAAKEKIVNAGRKRAAMMMEMKDEKIEFHEEEQHGEWPPYNPTWQEADPDDGPVPQDSGCWRNPLVYAPLEIQRRIPRVWVPDTKIRLPNGPLSAHLRVPANEQVMEVPPPTNDASASPLAGDYIIPKKKRKL